MSGGSGYSYSNPCGEDVAEKKQRRCVICCKYSVTTYEVSSGVSCCGSCFQGSKTLPIPYVCLNLEPWQVFEQIRGHNGC